MDGPESLEYIIKLSLLYRIVLFELLGIIEDIYGTSLKAFIESIDNRSATKKLNKYLKSLTPKEAPPTDEKLVTDIYSLLYDFVYSIAIYRTIHERGKRKYDQRKTKEHLWYSISDNCIQQAVSDWCKVFGSNSERTHYSKIYPAYTSNFEQAVKEKGIDLCEYSKEMKNFRDTFIAHSDMKENRRPIPKLNQALTICYLYEEFVICGTPGTSCFELENFFNNSKAEISQYMDMLGVSKI